MTMLCAVLLSASMASAVTLTGRVYEGQTGVEPPNADPIQGVTVTLYGSQNTGQQGTFVIDTDTTDAAGLYVLEATGAFDFFNIVETDPVGYTSVGATSVGGTVKSDNWIQYRYEDIFITPVTLTGNKFWDQEDLCVLNVFKWEDKNGDGIEDATTEPPLANWKICLDTNQNCQCDPGEPFKTTDATGWCTFDDLTTYTTYFLAEELPPGWQRTCPQTPPCEVKIETRHAFLPYEVRFGNQKVADEERDYGDAPASYGTLKPSGASHIAHTLRLGPTVDTESDGKPSTDAQGDDNAGKDDEDGMVWSSISGTGGGMRLQVWNTGSTSELGTVTGWFDLDRNGQFDPVAEWLGMELVLVPPGGQTDVTFSVTIPPTAPTGPTFARFRLYWVDPNPMAPQWAVLPIGDAGKGEVEDYFFDAASSGGGPSVPGEERYAHMKWSQPPVEIDPQVQASPVFCGWDEPAFSVLVPRQQRQWAMVADDFHCLGPIPVTSVRWWGSFADWDQDGLPSVAPTAFHIGFWTGIASTDTAYPAWGHPGKLIWGKTTEDWRWAVAGDDQAPAGSGTSLPAAGLVAHWRLDGDAADSAGTSHGTVRGNPVWTTGQVGSALKLDGLDDYVDLPIGSLIRQLTNSTFAVWVNWSTAGGLWQRVFDFGTGTNVYMFLTPSAGAGPLRFSITTAGGAAEQQVTAPATLAGGWHHVAVVIDATAHSMKLYLDGAVVAANTATTLTPSALGQTTQNWLGRSQYGGDAYYQGLIDDMRVYNRALSADEIKSLMTPLPAREACFEFNCDLPTSEWFRQDRFTTEEQGFWISITAMYPGSSAGPNPWGWTSRPTGWRDTAVRFAVAGDLQPGLVVDPQQMTLVHDEGVCGPRQDYDMAFELRTDPNWVKWDQPFSGLRDWVYYADVESQGTSIRDQENMGRLVADDWLCGQNTPVIAAAWWGSYRGSRYEACNCAPQPDVPRPDYFRLVISTDAEANGQTTDNRPGAVVWEYRAYDYDEVLVGCDKDPESEPNEPVFRYSVRLPQANWFRQEAPGTIYWFSVAAVYTDPLPLIVHPWGWTNHAHMFGSAASSLDNGARPRPEWRPLRDPLDRGVDMSFTLYTLPMGSPEE